MERAAKAALSLCNREDKNVSFPIKRIKVDFRKKKCLVRTARGTWNFSGCLATLAQGSASEVHMNMDVNLHRLPEKRVSFLKFLVPFAVLM